MNSESSRSYRKNLITSGLCYINGEEMEVSVINMSMTGMLVQLGQEGLYENDAEKVFTIPSASKVIDFYLPQLRLAGTAEVVRASKDDLRVLLALKFKDMTYNIDNMLYKRKVYRKNMSIAGKIFLNNEHYDFQTVNVSVEGLMIRLSETISIVEGLTTTFEFKDINLKGEVEVVWADFDERSNTLVGLKYINMNTDKIKGIPRFSTDTIR